METAEAERIVKAVVDMLAEKRYDEIPSVAELASLTVVEVKELVEEYLALNGLSHLDRYDVKCNFHPRYTYKQLELYQYTNGSGCHIDYDLTTDQELNDLTLQMEFLYQGEQGIKARLLDLHVM